MLGTTHLLATLTDLWLRFDPLVVLNPTAVVVAVRDNDPLFTAVAAALYLAAYSFVVTEATGNYSSVDRLWSIVPALYAVFFAAMSAWHPRCVLMAVLAVVWGARLSFNFWRKGGFNGEEDYRWPELRRIIANRWLFRLFNLTFIATYQHLLLLAFTLPAYVACAAARAGTAPPLHALDAAAAALFAALVLLETAADQQQWRFQEHKRALRAAGAPLTGDARRGFLTQGLFRYSRHPNFFAEQALWWAFYGLGVAACGAWLNWSVAGTVLLTLLFQGSTTFTEALSTRRYPAYPRYQRTTSRLVPWCPGPALTDDE
jgi:steroid 5-alpha reductase family enzyme